MTNKEKFKEVFGLEIDDSSDCGFFDCSDKLCKDCPVKETKSWWNTEYMPPQSGEWVTMTYDAYVDLLSQTVKALEQEPLDGDYVSREKVKEILRSGVSLDLDEDKDYVCDLIDKLQSRQ